MEKSKYFLSNSLLNLMQEKPYEKISIHEVARRGYVSRTTFYNHFSSKEDILQFLIENAMGTLREIPMPENEPQYLAFLEADIARMEQNRALLLLLRKNGLIELVPEYQRRILHSLAKGSEKVSKFFPDDRSLEAFCRYESAPTFYSAFWFLEREAIETPAQLARIMSDTRRIGYASRQEERLYLRDLSDPTLRFHSGDARALATKEALHKAFQYLLERQAPDNIGITQLTQEAGVSRCSFYRHYDRLEDLIEESLQMIYADVIKTLPSTGHLIGYAAILEASIRGYQAQASLFQSISKGRLELLALRAYRSVFDVLEWQLPYIKQYYPADPFAREYYSWFLAVEHIIPVLLYFDYFPDMDPGEYADLIRRCRYFPYL